MISFYFLDKAILNTFHLHFFQTYMYTEKKKKRKGFSLSRHQNYRQKSFINRKFWELSFLVHSLKSTQKLKITTAFNNAHRIYMIIFRTYIYSLCISKCIYLFYGKREVLSPQTVSPRFKLITQKKWRDP